MIFLNSVSFAAALVFYLPGVCTHTDTEGKQREARVGNILKSSEKTQYLMNTLYILYYYKFCNNPKWKWKSKETFYDSFLRLFSWKQISVKLKMEKWLKEKKYFIINVFENIKTNRIITWRIISTQRTYTWTHYCWITFMRWFSPSSLRSNTFQLPEDVVTHWEPSWHKCRFPLHTFCSWPQLGPSQQAESSRGENSIFGCQISAGYRVLRSAVQRRHKVNIDL